MFFSDIFHVSIRADGYILLSICTDQYRVDEYSFTRSEIELTLNDSPTDNVWSGSDRFALKRTQTVGKVRIQVALAKVVYKVTRNQVDILNSLLVDAVRNAPHIERQESGVEIQIIPAPQKIEPDLTYLFNQLKDFIRSELRKLEIPSPVIVSEAQKHRQPPTPTFIPRDIGKDLKGEIRQRSQHGKSKGTLEAVKKLRRIKK